VNKPGHASQGKSSVKSFTKKLWGGFKEGGVSVTEAEVGGVHAEGY